MSLKVRLVDSRVGIRNAFTRMPFRFGVVTLRAAPVCTLEAVIEDERGHRAHGYAADFLAYRWFDKRPERTLAANVADLLRAIDTARAAYAEAAAAGPAAPFDLWCETHEEVERRCLADGFNRLGASFGSSMLERAVIDAAGRLLGRSYRNLVVDGSLGIDLGRLFPELTGRSVDAFLPDRPLTRVNLRHTIGLVDPITAGDVAPGERVGDGLPETLEDYLRVDGIRYLKVKVAGDREADLARLGAIAAVLDAAGVDYRVTLDGNEQYKTLDAFADLVEAMRAAPGLRRFFDAVLFIEQPLERSVAMAPEVAPALAALSAVKPVIIDEADGWPTAFREAMELGYRGVSHKNCKGIYKSLGNLALAVMRNAREGAGRYVLSAEDLTNLGVVPLNADLASVALLGIPHVERNGHHYFLGLDHLPAAEQQAALADHPDLYARHDGHVVMRIVDGALTVRSLQVAGMGFRTPPDMDAMTPAEDWSFASLGIADRDDRQGGAV